MKVMTFIDNSNFFNSIRCLQEDHYQDRVIDYNRLNKFVLNFLSKNSQYKNEILFHVRTYYYDGEYTDILINKIKKHISSIPSLPENQEEINKINLMLERTIKGIEAQKRQMGKMKSFYFFETRLKPLQYSKNQGIFQKGVDVQLAVDLVSNAYLNNYDVAVLFSGDIDLYESVKLVKSLGKQVIVFSHEKLMAQSMITLSDFYKDICRLEDGQLDEFSHIFERKEESSYKVV
ncbi:NYN domain-containing protein [Candidatus Pacearchaeota archaeon]|nr:NYN domain-containing protein [Candidatus Pacearchaeota archaeon]